MFFKKSWVVVCVAIFVLLVGCKGEKIYDQTQANVGDVVQRQQIMRHKADCLPPREPALTVNPGLYVDRTPISLAREPAWLKSHIVIRGDELPFSYYSRTIVNGGGRFVLI